jgi:nicotinamidase-related amidase
MPTINNDLHGSAPDTSPVALIIIDMISTFYFEDGEALFEQTRPIIPKLAELRRRCKQANIPVVYVNDNYGKWQSDWSKLIEHCRESDRGRQVLERLQPDADDYFILKPKQSGFFATTLETLLLYFKAHTLILTGVAGDICVLFTAHDAYMRDYQIVVPKDCIASNSAELTAQALDQMERVMKADTRPSSEIDLDRLKQPPQEE